MICSFILLLYVYDSMGFGYDSGADQSTCGRPYRSGRIYQPPCDLEKESYCVSAGKTYPWRAVKRFVTDNQGLMRRMYGDQRHGHVLKAELDDDLDLWSSVPLPLSRYYQQQEKIDKDLPRSNSLERGDDEPRLLHDDVTNEDFLNTKFVYSKEPPISINKINDVIREPSESQTDSSTQQIETKVISEQTNNLEGTTTESTTEPIDGLDNVTLSSAEITTEPTLFTSKDETILNPEILNSEISSFTTSKTVIHKTTAYDQIESNKVDTMLFQDAEDVPKKKKPINWNVRGINACPVKEEVVAPFWANNTRGEVLALLNMYPFEQYVHWEKCTYEHRQMYCREGCRCEQQYRLHRLLAYDPNNECRGIFSDWFRFPSCCVCKCYDMPYEFRVTSRSPRYKLNLSDL